MKDAFQKIQNTSPICTSSLHRGHANLTRFSVCTLEMSTVLSNSQISGPSTLSSSLSQNILPVLYFSCNQNYAVKVVFCFWLTDFQHDIRVYLCCRSYYDTIPFIPQTSLCELYWIFYLWTFQLFILFLQMFCSLRKELEFLSYVIGIGEPLNCHPKHLSQQCRSVLSMALEILDSNLHYPSD